MKYFVVVCITISISIFAIWSVSTMHMCDKLEYPYVKYCYETVFVPSKPDTLTLVIIETSDSIKLDTSLDIRLGMREVHRSPMFTDGKKTDTIWRWTPTYY